MKNILFTFVIGLLSLGTYAQDIISEQFGHLEDRDEATQIEITGKLFSLATHIENTGDKEADQVLDFVSTIKHFKALAFEKLETAESEYKKGLSALKGVHEELMVIRSPEGSFSLYVDESNGIVHELVGIGTDNEAFGVFSLIGNMDLKQIGKFAAEIQMEGFDKMEKIKDYNVSEVKVYPNPVSTSETFTLQTSEELVGAVATMYDESGRAVKEINVDDTLINIRTNDLSSGIYYVDISTDAVSVKKKLIVID